MAGDVKAAAEAQLRGQAFAEASPLGVMDMRNNPMAEAAMIEFQKRKNKRRNAFLMILILERQQQQQRLKDEAAHGLYAEKYDRSFSDLRQDKPRSGYWT